MANNQHPEPKAMADASAPKTAATSGASQGTLRDHQGNGVTSRFNYHFLSDILDRPVYYEGEARRFGRLQDIGAGAKSPYPVAASLRIRSRDRRLVDVPWTSVVSLSRQGLVVRRETAAAPPADFWLRRDVLDDQVVDISGAKVVRVNDVHLLYAQGQLIIGHVEVGMLGILRRLGLEKIVSALLRWLMDYTIKECFITWHHVELIPSGPTPGGLRVAGTISRLAEVHPAELADILEELGIADRQTVMSSLPVETAAEALEELDPEVQRAFIAQQEPGRAADLLDEMPAQEAAAVLRDVHDSDAEKIISRMESEAAEDVRTILAHEESTAGGAMATSCLEARPHEPAGVVLERIRGLAEEVEVFSYVYVLDSGRRLLGVLSLRELLAAPADREIAHLMAKNVVKVTPDASLREAAKLVVKYGFRAIPVVTEDGVFLGAVRLVDVIEELSPLLRD